MEQSSFAAPVVPKLVPITIFSLSKEKNREQHHWLALPLQATATVPWPCSGNKDSHPDRTGRGEISLIWEIAAEPGFQRSIRNSDCDFPPQTCLLRETGMGQDNKFHSGTSASWDECILQGSRVLPAAGCAAEPAESGWEREGLGTQRCWKQPSCQERHFQTETNGEC